jgi:hypothetical protein
VFLIPIPETVQHSTVDKKGGKDGDTFEFTLEYTPTGTTSEGICGAVADSVARAGSTTTPAVDSWSDDCSLRCRYTAIGTLTAEVPEPEPTPTGEEAREDALDTAIEATRDTLTEFYAHVARTEWEVLGRQLDCAVLDDVDQLVDVLMVFRVDFGIERHPPGFEGIDDTATFVAIGEEETDTNGPGQFQADGWRLQAYDAMDVDGPRYEAIIQGPETDHIDMAGRNPDIRRYNVTNALELFATDVRRSSDGTRIGERAKPPDNTVILSRKGV